MKRCAPLWVALAAICLAAAPPLGKDQQAVLKHISPVALKDHLSFLASDDLQGRATPSRGLDAAADYIAAQFRRAGLEPASNGTYFQTANVVVREPNRDGLILSISVGVGAARKTLKIAPEETSITLTSSLDLDDVILVLVDGNTRVTPQQIDGKMVLVLDGRDVRGLGLVRPVGVIRAVNELPGPQVYDPDGRPPENRALIANAGLADFVRGAPNPRITIHARAAKEHRAEARNVAGILRGSDPMLSKTFVLLTAHYDHLGVSSASGDHIFNGANDDASGVASVMEIASALGAMAKHPARGIVFMTFFGEEHGLMGSAYYTRHPLVPLADTIADLNLEQLGRTDSTTGPQIKTASITGFDFSDLPRILADAAQPAGIKVYKDNKYSDPYFADSDNLTFATFGIPAHTLCVAYQFPDYHRVTDRADKIDYANMAAVDGAVALGLLRLASDGPPPQWNESSEPAKRYSAAAAQLHP